MRKIILLLIAFVTAVASVFAQEEVSHIEVVGEASIKVTPAEVVIYVPVQIEKELYEETYQELVNKLSILQSELKKIRLDGEQLKISDFSIVENSKYFREEDETRKIGYKGKATLRIVDSYESNLVRDIIKVLAYNECTYRLRFQLSEEQKDKLREEAVIKAVADAKRKARQLSEAANIILGDILGISYGTSRSYRGSYVIEEEAESIDESRYRGISTLDLSPKQINVNKSVWIRWAIDM